ncbi:hypothetical protein PENANT_c030G00157 [Penicillium antarcticum]|uniref:Uncharacterized protein n=1 Tax=Penicillium antarcticum TaxID=416450 RepID=A0A1V6PVE6_9EURO|nr:hypothetical protein PENANT_c030G00157 [Penicillium antarcticum]
MTVVEIDLLPHFLLSAFSEKWTQLFIKIAVD